MKKEVDFGVAVPVGPQKDDYKHWLTDVETSAQQLQDHFRSL